MPLVNGKILRAAKADHRGIAEFHPERSRRVADERGQCPFNGAVKKQQGGAMAPMIRLNPPLADVEILRPQQMRHQPTGRLAPIHQHRIDLDIQTFKGVLAFVVDWSSPFRSLEGRAKLLAVPLRQLLPIK